MEHFGHLRHAALSDVGRKRRNNEDSFGEFCSIGVFCVADGMGGGDDGEVASAAVVRSVEMFANRNPLPNGRTFAADGIIAGLKSAVAGASKWIFERATERELKGCGSTFVGVCFDAANPSKARALHAGDSRLYRIRGKSIKQITKDHSAAEMIGARDDEEVNPMFRGMILRAVGTQPSVELEVTPFDVKEGDMVLMCSDGLYRMVPEKKIVAIAKAAASVKDAVSSLVAAANKAGGIDNVTAVLVEVGRLPPPLPSVDMVVPSADSALSEVEKEDSDTRDTNSKSAATFYVEAKTSATTHCTFGCTEASTRSTMTIPEENDSNPAVVEEEPSPRVVAGPSSWKDAVRGFLGRNRRLVAYAVVALVAVCFMSFVAARIAHGRRLEREAKQVAIEKARLAVERAEAEIRAKEEEKRKAEEDKANNASKEKAKLSKAVADQCFELMREMPIENRQKRLDEAVYLVSENAAAGVFSEEGAKALMASIEKRRRWIVGIVSNSTKVVIAVAGRNVDSGKSELFRFESALPSNWVCTSAGYDDVSLSPDFEGRMVVIDEKVMVPRAVAMQLPKLEDGVSCFFDGEVVTQSLKLRPGQHVCRYTRQGYEDQNISFPALFNKDGTLPQPQSWRAKPVRATVPLLGEGIVCRVDGKIVTGVVQLMPGEHNCVYERQDYKPQSKTFSVVVGVDVDLPPPGKWEQDKVPESPVDVQKSEGDRMNEARLVKALDDLASTCADNSFKAFVQGNLQGKEKDLASRIAESLDAVSRDGSSPLNTRRENARKLVESVRAAVGNYWMEEAELFLEDCNVTVQRPQAKQKKEERRNDLNRFIETARRFVEPSADDEVAACDLCCRLIKIIPRCLGSN